MSTCAKLERSLQSLVANVSKDKQPIESRLAAIESKVEKNDHMSEMIKRINTWLDKQLDGVDPNSTQDGADLDRKLQTLPAKVKEKTELQQLDEVLEDPNLEPFRKRLQSCEQLCHQLGREITAHEIREIEFQCWDSVGNRYAYSEQISTVRKYYQEFCEWKRWMNIVCGWEDSEEVVIGIFIHGLKEPIRNEMSSPLPASLNRAYWEAIAIELTLGRMDRCPEKQSDGACLEQELRELSTEVEEKNQMDESKFGRIDYVSKVNTDMFFSHEQFSMRFTFEYFLSIRLKLILVLNKLDDCYDWCLRRGIGVGVVENNMVVVGGDSGNGLLDDVQVLILDRISVWSFDTEIECWSLMESKGVCTGSDLQRQRSLNLSRTLSQKTVEDIWKDIVEVDDAKDVQWRYAWRFMGLSLDFSWKGFFILHIGKVNCFLHLVTQVCVLQFSSRFLQENGERLVTLMMYLWLHDRSAWGASVMTIAMLRLLDSISDESFMGFFVAVEIGYHSHASVHFGGKMVIKGRRNSTVIRAVIMAVELQVSSSAQRCSMTRKMLAMGKGKTLHIWIIESKGMTIVSRCLAILKAIMAVLHTQGLHLDSVELFKMQYVSSHDDDFDYRIAGQSVFLVVDHLCNNIISGLHFDDTSTIQSNVWVVYIWDGYHKWREKWVITLWIRMVMFITRTLYKGWWQTFKTVGQNDLHVKDVLASKSEWRSYACGVNGWSFAKNSYKYYDEATCLLRRMFFDAKLSYKELLDKVYQLANYLKDKGVEKGDVVTIYLPMLMELPIAVLACARIGDVHLLVVTEVSAEPLYQRIIDCKPKVVMTCNAVQADSVVYQMGNQLKELGDKVPTPVKEKLELKLGELKEAISSGSTQTMKDAMAALNQEVIQLGALYNQIVATDARLTPSADVAGLLESSDKGPDGDDFDKIIVDWMADDFKRNKGIDLMKNKQAHQRLTETAEKAKMECSSLAQANISLPLIIATVDGLENIETTLTRAKSKDLCSNFLDEFNTTGSNLRGLVRHREEVFKLQTLRQGLFKGRGNVMNARTRHEEKINETQRWRSHFTYLLAERLRLWL